MTNHLFFKNAVNSTSLPRSDAHMRSGKLNCGNGFSGAFKAVTYAILDGIISNPLPINDFLHHLVTLNSTLPTPYNFIQNFKSNSHTQAELAGKLLQVIVEKVKENWLQEPENVALWLLSSAFGNKPHLAVIYSVANILGLNIILSQTKDHQEIPHMVSCLNNHQKWTLHLGKFMIEENCDNYEISCKNIDNRILAEMHVPNLNMDVFSNHFFDQHQKAINVTALENLQQLRYMQEKNLLNNDGVLQLMADQNSKKAVFHVPNLKSPQSNREYDSYMGVLAWLMSCDDVQVQKQPNNDSTCALG